MLERSSAIVAFFLYIDFLPVDNPVVAGQRHVFLSDHGGALGHVSIDSIYYIYFIFYIFIRRKK